MLKCVTAVCMEAIPASATRSSHVPGRSARVGMVMKWIRKKRNRSFEVVIRLSELELKVGEESVGVNI